MFANNLNLNVIYYTERNLWYKNKYSLKNRERMRNKINVQGNAKN